MIEIIYEENVEIKDTEKHLEEQKNENIHKKRTCKTCKRN